ncbi:hypothetical protein KQX54_002156 [Cotesia glomerata]|uniref:Uncharacterized protein n=1 Tax=Cotesia glomerata TaxID=32391 RepID=A0AAV7IUZ0_COTGL|nr:hypothetical protein KQX54_002156 [Cotesia glomerata]
MPLHLERYKPLLTKNKYIRTTNDGKCIFVDTKTNSVVFVELKIYKSNPNGPGSNPDSLRNDDEAFMDSSNVSEDDALETSK